MGTGGRRFESCCPDQFLGTKYQIRGQQASFLWDDPLLNIESYLNGVSPSVAEAAKKLEDAYKEVSRLETEGIGAILTENQKQTLKAWGLLNDPIFATGLATAETIPDALALIKETQEKLADWQTKGWQKALSDSDKALLGGLGLLSNDLLDLNVATKDVSVAIQDWVSAYLEQMRIQTEGIKAITDENQLKQLEALGDIAAPLWELSTLPDTMTGLISGLVTSGERLNDLQLNGVRAILDANQARELEALGLLNDPLLGIRAATSLTIPSAVDALKNAQSGLLDLQNKGINGIIDELRKQTNLLSTPSGGSSGDWSMGSGGSSGNSSSSGSSGKKEWVEVIFDREQWNTGWYTREDYDKYGWSLPINQVEYRARGGDLAAGAYAVVGEEGPELIRMKSAAHVTPAGTTRSILGNQETSKQLEITNRLLSARLEQSQEETRALMNRLMKIENSLETLENKVLLADAAQ